jgi:hypothetical protein
LKMTSGTFIPFIFPALMSILASSFKKQGKALLYSYKMIKNFF